MLPVAISTWPALLKGTLKLIGLIVIPKPAFIFPGSDPRTAIPVYRTNARNAMTNAPLTPVNSTALSLFDRSQLESVDNTSYGPMSSTPHKPDPERSIHLRSRVQIEKEGCCCACHCLAPSSSQGHVRGSGRSLSPAHSPRPRRASSTNTSFSSPSRRPYRENKISISNPAPRTPTRSSISKHYKDQHNPAHELQDHQRHNSSQLMRRNKLSKPRPKPKKLGRWGQSKALAVALAGKAAVRKSGKEKESLINSDRPMDVPILTDSEARRRSLRRSKRIASSAMDGSGLVHAQSMRSKSSNANEANEQQVAVPQSLYEYSASLKAQNRSRSQSFAGQSRFFELDLSPIIEDVLTRNPPQALARSVVIRGEGEGRSIHSSSDEISPRSCSSFGEVLASTVGFIMLFIHAAGFSLCWRLRLMARDVEVMHASLLNVFRDDFGPV
ncbi:hypothetical protein FPV67DRAFT_1468591 [Lyophyllum atratum]|nr:hypothetical protein FPV67DRAFT_1468591 [Lyophyllum atratum]